LINFLSPVNDIQKHIGLGFATRADFISGFIEAMQHTGDPYKCWVQNIKAVHHLENPSKQVLPLEGLVIGVKDNISTDEFPTKMGTEHWEGTPGGFDARIIFKLRSSGATIGGKTVCSEFAVHQRTKTINPRYPNCEPGTSSSGSAAAIAANQVSVALGTQTAGSIIKPASYCGVIGFKPTFGEIPRTGILKTTELFDTVGFLGRRIADILAVFKESRVAGSNFPIHEKERSKIESLDLTSILVFSGEGIDDPSPNLKNSFNLFCETVGDKFKLNINYLKTPFNIWELRKAFEAVYSKDISYFLSDHKLEYHLSPSLREMFEYGESIDVSKYQKCIHILQEWRSFVRKIPGNPLILSLATSMSAPRIGFPDKIDANLLLTSAGNPQISLPLLRDDSGKLLGVCLSGKRFNDLALFSFAHRLFPSDALELPNFLRN
jgi:Asp-tRNA(Asn)/Glu-tRNA(Gln) amidotransferase A subunit family amidase